MGFGSNLAPLQKIRVKSKHTPQVRSNKINDLLQANNQYSKSNFLTYEEKDAIQEHSDCFKSVAYNIKKKHKHLD